MCDEFGYAESVLSSSQCVHAHIMLVWIRPSTLKGKRRKLGKGKRKEGLGNNYRRKWTKRWNAAVSVDEGKYAPSSMCEVVNLII